MTSVADTHRRLAAAFAARADSVPPDRWDDATRCERWTARQLMQHMVDTCRTFLGFVGIQLPELPSVDEDPVAAWKAADAVVQSALADPAIAEREYEGYQGRTTFEQGIGAFADFDLVVHAWDLARATGGDERLDPADVDTVFAAARGFGDLLRTSGTCGPEVPAPPGADEQTQLLAFLGRRA